VNALVNSDLFGFAIRWFRDFDLQQAVFVGCLDILGIYTQGQDELPFEFSKGSFPSEIVVFLDKRAETGIPMP
jgi:hypothetical protein